MNPRPMRGFCFLIVALDLSSLIGVVWLKTNASEAWTDSRSNNRHAINVSAEEGTLTFVTAIQK
jgi:hypothetical protein